MNTSVVMTPEDTQLANEYRFSRKHIDKYIRADIESNPSAFVLQQRTVSAIEEWLQHDPGYDSKRVRKQQVSLLNINELAWDVVVTVAYCQTPEMLRTVGVQLAGKLGFTDKRDGMVTACELITIAAMVDVLDITRGKHIGIESKYAESLYCHSVIPLTERVVDYVINSEYLPPLVCKPEDLKGNHSSAYLTHDSSVILNGGYTELHQALDALDRQNQTGLRLNHSLLSSLPERPNKPFDTPEQQTNWTHFVETSVEMTGLMLHQSGMGKRPIYLEHRFDQRGRMYATGYHISTQGTAYKKAALQFHKEELVDVPEQFQIKSST